MVGEELWKMLSHLATRIFPELWDPEAPLAGNIANIAGAITAGLKAISLVVGALVWGIAQAKKRTWRPTLSIQNDPNVKEHQGFVGREKLLQAINTFIGDPRRGAMLLIGPYGVGKSALMAELIRRPNLISAYHFCKGYIADSRDPMQFVRNISDQLAERFPTYKRGRDAFLRSERGSRINEANSYAQQAIIAPLLARPLRQPPLIIIDGLDEASADETFLTTVKYLCEAATRSQVIRLIMTSRQNAKVPSELNLKPVLMEQEAKENQDDIRNYLRQRLKEPALQQAIAHIGGDQARAIEFILERSEGKFLFVAEVLRELAEGEVKDLGQPGQRAFRYRYSEGFKRLFPDRAEYERNVAPILEVIVAAREPLTAHDISYYTNREVGDVTRVMDHLAEYFRKVGEHYRADHFALIEWLTGSADRNRDYYTDPIVGHRTIFERERDLSEPKDERRWKQLAFSAERLDQNRLTDRYAKDQTVDYRAVRAIAQARLLPGMPNATPDVLDKDDAAEADRIAQISTGQELERAYHDAVAAYYGANNDLAALDQLIERARGLTTFCYAHAWPRAKRTHETMEQILLLHVELSHTPWQFIQRFVRQQILFAEHSYANGHTDDGDRILLSALAKVQELVKMLERMPEPQPLKILWKEFEAISDAFRNAGRMKHALLAAQEELRLGGWLSQLWPNDPDGHRCVAWGYTDIGYLLSRLDQMAEAGEYLRKACQRSMLLYQANPELPENLRLHASAHLDMSLWYSENEQQSLALPYCDEGSRAITRLFEMPDHGLSERNKWGYVRYTLQLLRGMTDSMLNQNDFERATALLLREKSLLPLLVSSPLDVTGEEASKAASRMQSIIHRLLTRGWRKEALPFSAEAVAFAMVANQRQALAPASVENMIRASLTHAELARDLEEFAIAEEYYNRALEAVAGLGGSLEVRALCYMKLASLPHWRMAPNHSTVIQEAVEVAWEALLPLAEQVTWE